jgi:dTDP-glucose 4,6-dehydratase
MRIIVTGGAGFIGSAYVRYLLDRHPADEIVILDLLTYAGNPANLNDLRDQPRQRFVHGDIADEALVGDLVSAADAVVNFAAETHVDRSLVDASAFVRTNMMGLVSLLNAVRRHGKRLVQISTDEVYGDIAPGHFSVESDPLLPRSPYAAAKAGGELLCRSYVVSYGTDVVITRGCNVVGPRQYPEKLIPLFITNALREQALPVYGDGLQIRDWLYVDDTAAAIDLVLRRGRSGEVYNIGAGNHRTNIEVVRSLLRYLGKPEHLIVHVPDRPGHDRRYALDASKIQTELGWKPTKDFNQMLRETIDWYRAHPAWWQAIRDDNSSFAEYYQSQYGWRLAEAATL